MGLTRGIERFCLSLSEHLVKKGYEVVIYIWASPNKKLCVDINKNIKIRKVPYSRWYQREIAVFFYRLWLKFDNPKATILNFLYHGEQHLPKGRKYIFVLHAPASLIRNRYEYIQSVIHAFRDISVVGVSEMVKNEAVPFVGNVSLSMIYNGTDIDLFKPTKTTKSGKILQIVTAAAFEERKGMHRVIKSIASYPRKNQLHYDIYGSGNTGYGEVLNQLIADNHLEDIVSLMGSVSNIHNVLPQYDLFAMPSTGEAFGLSVVEGMACGLPVLVSNIPPYTEFVHEDFGFLVSLDDDKEYHRAFDTLLDNDDIYERMSLAARKSSEFFSWDNVVERYMKLF